VSQRQACRVVKQPRSTQRYQRKDGPRQAEEARLRKHLHELARAHPRYGYRRVTVLLQREGWRINRKRVRRLLREEGLKVPRSRRVKRQLKGASESSIVHAPAQHANDVWAWDFAKSFDERGRPLRWLSIIDEYTRELIVIHVSRSITSEVAIEALHQAIRERGLPCRVRSDNGPEFIAQALGRYVTSAEIGTLYIAPASPWENGYVESYHSKLRDELLNMEVIENVKHAQSVAQRWKQSYNEFRPHSSLGNQTPREYADSLREAAQEVPEGAGCPSPPNPSRKTKGRVSKPA